MLTDNNADVSLLGMIDSFYLTTMGDLDELYAGHSGKGEEDFLIQFLQTSMKSKALARQDEIPPNDENRNVIFNAFDSIHILNLNFKDVVTFYK